MAETQEPRQPIRWLLAAVVVVALAIFGFSAFKGSLATYTHDFADVRARSGELLQVPGVIDHAGRQHYDLERGWFEFEMLDVETRTQRLTVRSRRVKPGNFDEASQVVCIGTFKDGVFEARDLLVKCPSKEVDKLRASEGGGSRP